MRYRGQRLDAISLWEKYVDFPSKMPESGFAPLVVCPNPDHNTTKRHFQVNLDQPTVHCFAGCGISGRYDKAIAMIEGCTEKEARKLIRQHTSVDLGGSILAKKKGRKAVNLERENNLDYDRYVPQVAVEYLSGRGITADSISRFLLGWDMDSGRIVLPAHDERHILRFLIKRAIKPNDWPKYLYSEDSEKTSILYGACNFDLKQIESDGLVLVEGSLDAISMHQDGFRNTGGTLGTYLSRKQAQLISKMRPPCVYLMFDKDAAGYNAIRHAEKMLISERLKVCLYPSGRSDPAELTKDEKTRSIERAVSITKFNRRVREAATIKPERRSKVDNRV